MTKFVAGRYTGTFNGKALGQTDGGYRISHQFFKRLIQGDLAGQTAQDAIYMGREQMVGFTLLEANESGVAELIEPYGGTPGTPLVLGNVGEMDVQGAIADGTSPTTRAAQALVLTAIAGTPAHDAGPLTLTFPLTAIAENYPIEQLYGPDLRDIPVRLRCYPDMAAEVFGTVT